MICTGVPPSEFVVRLLPLLGRGLRRLSGKSVRRRRPKWAWICSIFYNYTHYAHKIPKNFYKYEFFAKFYAKTLAFFLRCVLLSISFHSEKIIFIKKEGIKHEKTHFCLNGNSTFGGLSPRRGAAATATLSPTTRPICFRKISASP